MRVKSRDKYNRGGCGDEYETREEIDHFMTEIQYLVKDGGSETVLILTLSKTLSRRVSSRSGRELLMRIGTNQNWHLYGTRQNRSPHSGYNLFLRFSLDVSKRLDFVSDTVLPTLIKPSIKR